MGYLIDGYKIMGQEAKAYAVKHRAGIGTAISIGGTIVSNILSTRAGAKSARMIDAKQMELGRMLTTGEKLKLCWTNHISSGAAATLSCIGAGYSHNEHVKDFNKVAMAYSGVKKLYDSTKKATREVLGEKKNAELQDKLNQKYIEEHPEVKQKIISQKVNPDPHTMQKYWEPEMGEVFFCTKDKIEMALTVMRAEMKALKPRNHKNHIPDESGIKLRRFYELIEADIPEEKLISESLNKKGFLKGENENGSDDDPIDIYYTPMLLKDDTESCIAINWEKSPSDLRYGDYFKL